MGGYQDGEVPIIVRGDGCYLEDSKGKRYLDALAGLFSVNIGYGFGEEVGEAAAAQMRELPFYTNWGYAHPRAIELASEVASLTPGDLNRLFFVSGGSEPSSQSGSSRGIPHRCGEGRRWKATSRQSRTTDDHGCLSIKESPSSRAVRAARARGHHVRNTTATTGRRGDEAEFTRSSSTISRDDRRSGADTVAW